VSIGLSVYPDDTIEAESLVSSADLAMYRAKADGRNTFQYFTEGLNTEAREWLTLENGLCHALDNSELFLVYQPQVNLESGRLEGVEALIRWRHPSLGLIMPDTFIPIAEQSGLIVGIGEWVLDSACRQLLAWDANGLDIPKIAVNISARHLRNNRIRDDVQRILGEHGIAQERICLELTEHALLESGTTQSGLNLLGGCGLHISLDDFGTGHSSLNNLKRFPVRELKIDRGFVDGIGSCEHDFAIAKAIITLGQSLGMQVVGEGVETPEQAEILLREGCRIAQGYYFAKPLPPAELECWVRRRGS
jgi:EAL domain-containing protein (putative c-di-GMP-specific phosphodiesterase class I)